MFLVHFEANTVYAVFQDLSEESKDISLNISKELEDKEVPLSLHKRIKGFFNDNKKVRDNFHRQKAYISTLRTYIDIVSTNKHKNVYYLNLYVLPKDIELEYNKDEIAKSLIRKIDKLSLNIYKLYDSLIGHKDIRLKSLQLVKGNTFLDLELSFYLQKLNKLHDYLLNYKRSLKDKIICSDKDVGIMVESLNSLEDDPLKRYQFVKVSHQQDLIIFVYALTSFLEKERVDYFKSHPLYNKLKSILSRINNYLLKISTSTHIRKEKVTFKSLHKFFNYYANSSEIQKNKSIYNILESIFSNQLREGAFISKSIDMTKMFEKVVENTLKSTYNNNLFVGKEPDEIDGKDLESKKYLNSVNHLLEDSVNDDPLVKQFPDFLIKESNLYHIIDAKYKLQDYLLKDRTMIWQILIYSKLFNQSIIDYDKIKKIIVFVKKSSIDLDDLDNITIAHSKAIDINNCDWYYNETMYGSRIGFIGMRTLQNFS